MDVTAYFYIQDSQTNVHFSKVSLPVEKKTKLTICIYPVTQWHLYKLHSMILFIYKTLIAIYRYLTSTLFLNSQTIH